MTRAPLADAPSGARPGGPAAPPASHPRRWAIFTTVAIGVFMATLDGSIVTLALPTLSRELGGVVQAGDVRARSIKRIASAVGEGSMSVAFVHQYLATL